MNDTGKSERALDLAVEAGFCEGGHHKQWYLDRIIRCLLEGGYQAWRDEIDASDHEWDEGIAP